MRLWQLEGDLRQALDNYFGGMVSGPWEKVIEALAETIQAGHISLEMAAHLNLLLLRTTSDAPDTCQTCDCPCPGMAHR
jgi:hypothetical protein